MDILVSVYPKLRIANIETKDVGHTFPVMIRDDIPHINETLELNVRSADFVVILGGSHTYTLHWTNYVPQHIDIYGDGFEKYVFLK